MNFKFFLMTFKILSCLYFFIINFMLFAFLTKKITLPKKVKIGIIIFIAVVFCVNLFRDSVAFLFLHLVPIVLILIHFFGSLLIYLLSSSLSNDKQTLMLSNKLIKLFNFMRFYLIYFFALIFQIITIFEN
jgi:hypothetical protein